MRQCTDLKKNYFDMFRDWQELTNQIFCGAPLR